MCLCWIKCPSLLLVACVFSLLLHRLVEWIFCTIFHLECKRTQHTYTEKFSFRRRFRSAGFLYITSTEGKRAELLKWAPVFTALYLERKQKNSIQKVSVLHFHRKSQWFSLAACTGWQWIVRAKKDFSIHFVIYFQLVDFPFIILFLNGISHIRTILEFHWIL